MTRPIVLRTAPAIWIAATMSMVAGWLALRFAGGAGLASFADDGVSYLIMAQVYSPYHDAVPAVAQAFHFESYPPLYPLVLALLGGAHDFARAHQVVITFFAAGVFATYLFARGRGLTAFPALAVALAVAMAPASWLGMLRIISENLYTLLLLVAMYIHEQDRTGQRAGNQALLAALLTAAVMTRSVGMVLVGAYIVVLAIGSLGTRRLPGWREVSPVLLTTAVLVAWYLLRPVHNTDRYITDVEWIFPRMAEEGVVGYLGTNIGAIVEGWYTVTIGYWTGYGSPPFVLATLLGVLAVSGVVRDLCAGRLAGWYVLGYLVLLVFWPHPGQMIRFVGALLPLMLVLAMESAITVGTRFISSAHSTVVMLVPVVLVLAMVLPSTAFYFTRSGQHTPLTGIAEYYYYPDLSRATAVAADHYNLFEDMRRIARTTPPEAVIIWHTPNYISLLAQRRAVPVPVYEDARKFYQAVYDSGADHVFLARLNPRDTRVGSNGLAVLPWFEPVGEVIWRRGRGEAGLQSILMRIDKKKLQALLASVTE